MIRVRVFLGASAIATTLSCGGAPTTANTAAPIATVAPSPLATPTPAPTVTATPTPAPLTDDEALYRFITQEQPFQSYRLFPNTSEISSGRLDGASAHPTARVRINGPAAQSLEANGKLPAGGRFRNGSVIVKEVMSGGQAPLLAVMRRDGANQGSGWQWAEFRPNGQVVYSVAGRGGSCIECHSRQLGNANDLVRTFERQDQ